MTKETKEAKFTFTFDLPKVESILYYLKNVGVDVACGACMEMAFTGATTNKHTHEESEVRAFNKPWRLPWSDCRACSEQWDCVVKIVASYHAAHPLGAEPPYEGPICFVCDKPSAPGQTCSPECAAKAAEADGVETAEPEGEDGRQSFRTRRPLIVQVYMGHGSWGHVKEPLLHPNSFLSYLGTDGNRHTANPSEWRSNGPVPFAPPIPAPLTASEEQRRSFAYGNVSLSNPDVTRDVVDRAADEMEMSAPAPAPTSTLPSEISSDMAVADDMTRALAPKPNKVPRKLADDPVLLALAGDVLRRAEGRPSWSTSNLPGQDVGRVRAVLAAIDAYLEGK